MATALKTFWWTKPSGSYGEVRAATAADARKKKPGAKIHTKPPYSWITPTRAPKKATAKKTAKKTSRAPKKTSRPTKKAAPKKTSRAPRPKAPPKKTSRAPAKRAAPRKAAKKRAPRAPSHPDLRSETTIEEKSIAEAHRLLAKWKIPGYEVIFSEKARFRRTMGLCNMRDRVITFSRLLWDRATPEQRQTTVIHEVAHAVVRDDHGPLVNSHGAEWKSQMRQMGIPKPQAKHTVPTHGLSGRRDMVAVVCGGCGAFDMSVKRLKRRGATARSNSQWTGLTCTGRCAGKLNFLSDGDRNRFKRLVSALASNGRSELVSVCGCGG